MVRGLKDLSCCLSVLTSAQLRSFTKLQEVRPISRAKVIQFLEQNTVVGTVNDFQQKAKEPEQLKSFISVFYY